MNAFALCRADKAARAELEVLFPALKELSEPARTRTINALYTAIENSDFASYTDVPFSMNSTHYPLHRHINEVAALGLREYAFALEHWQDEWTEQIDREELLQLLLLHDVDKPLLLGASDAAAQRRLYCQHGVLGAMILRALEIPDRMAMLVSTHSPSAGMHTADPMAAILHYADLYSCDHIYMLVGRKPNYFL